MKFVPFFLLALLLAAATFLLWITGKPELTELTDAATSAQLDSMLPSDAENGNKVDTYANMKDMYGTLMTDIGNAKHHIHFLFFKYEPDGVGREIGAALAAQTQAGVEVRLLYDDILCRRWRDYYRQLESQGVETAGFGAVHPPFIRKRDYYRNHRKIIVVDGRVAYIGGINVADRYLNGLDWGCWRDTIIRIEGPAVALAQRAFAADWHYATDRLLAAPVYFPEVCEQGAFPVRIITSGPIGAGPAIMRHTVSLLDRASQYVWFESPYFIPPDEVRKAMLDAARRGVDVRVLLPPRGDRGETTQWASKSYFTEALRAGVRIGLYQPGYLHSKIIVCDDAVGVVGSCNIDPRSYLLCEEIAAVIESPAYARELKDLFLTDEAQSHYIRADEWDSRPLANKVKEAAARTLASQL